MSTHHPVLSLKFIFRALVIFTAYATGVFGTQILAIISIVLLLVFAVLLTLYEYEEDRIQPASEELNTTLSERILPRFVNEYARIQPSPPEIRLNVMILRRRNWTVWSQERRVWPWTKTMKIEASYGDYKSNRESDLEWKTHEGVAGAAINKRSNEVWSSLEKSDIDIQSVWHLTDKQYTRTNHLDSVLSVPIYTPSDEDKTSPVGVLNIDSEAPLSETGFERQDIRQEAIYYANLIGAIVE